jgi:hypothetical protein
MRLPTSVRNQWPLFLFLALGLLFFGPVVVGGRVFVPAQFLSYHAPWSAFASPENRPPWNPLMYDSVGQFYPWHQFATDSVRQGTLPLWNPYQFCGAPFLANSQSGVLYPGNLLHYLLGSQLATGWSAWLHLVLAATFMCLFLRGLGVGAAAGALGGIGYAFSTWQIAWLHLPTFLATSCWLPLVLWLVCRLFAGGGWVSLGFAIAMSLLAGHLQIAFYVLLAAGLLALYLAVGRLCAHQPRTAAWGIGLFVMALLLAGMLAAPQLIPTLELSRQSHRSAAPSAQGYEAYTAYALSTDALATLFMPDLFGNPSTSDPPYFGASRGRMYFNYAEGALYVGLSTLFLAAYALLRRRQPERLLPFFGGLALLALLMALGTAVDALFYFYVPGFGQSGSPGRALVLWAFALNALAALGYEKLTNDNATPIKTAGIAIAVVAILATASLIKGTSAALSIYPAAIEAWNTQWPRQAGLFVLSAGIVLALAAGKMRTGWMALLPLGILVADLFAIGFHYNPSATPAAIYPVTQSLRILQQGAQHERIMPINTDWRFSGPQAVLPPNAAMVFRLRDVQGYDSLFPGRYKAFMNRLAKPGEDSSPPEVGNMVFAKTADLQWAAQAGVRYILSLTPLSLAGAREAYIDQIYLYELYQATGRVRIQTDDGHPVSFRWLEDGTTRVGFQVEAPAPATLLLADQYYPGWQALLDDRQPLPIQRVKEVFRQVRVPAGRHIVRFQYRPAGFRMGLYLMLLGILVGGFALVAQNLKAVPSRK